jgi:hypothetical protein
VDTFSLMPRKEHNWNVPTNFLVRVLQLLLRFRNSLLIFRIHIFDRFRNSSAGVLDIFAQFLEFGIDSTSFRRTCVKLLSEIQVNTGYSGLVSLLTSRYPENSANLSSTLTDASVKKGKSSERKSDLCD